MQIDSSKGVRLYQIIHCHNVLLTEPVEVDRAPFFAFVPLPVPHTFYGNNFAARCIPTQNARTVLIRGVLDHTAITTNPRWAVVSGGLLNPREMLENRLGGLVNVRRPDSIAPLPQNNLNPFVFEVLKQLSAGQGRVHGHLLALEGSEQGRDQLAELVRSDRPVDDRSRSASEDCSSQLRAQLVHPDHA
jgi:hypothetical protein